MREHPTRADEQRGSTLWRLAWLPLCALLVGVLAGVHPLWWPQAKQLLLYIGQAKLAAIDPALPVDDDKSEYLVVLHDDAQRASAQ